MKTREFCLIIATASVAFEALSSAARGDDIALYAWAAGNENTLDVYVDAANEQLAGFEITYGGPAFFDYWTQIRTRYAGGDGPCLLMMTAEKTAAHSALLTPLDELLANAGRSRDEYDDTLIQSMTVDGKLLALPYDASVLVIYYDKALFRKYAVPEPTDKFTTDQFHAALQSMSQGDDKGFALSNSWFFFAPFLNAAEIEWLSEDGKLALTAPGVMAGLQAYFDLAKNGYADPMTAGETATQQDAFIAGNVGMIVGGPWDFSSLKVALGDDLGVAEVPSPDGNGPQTVVGSGFGIAPTCQNKAAAFEALLALTSEQSQERIVRDLNMSPAMKSVQSAFLKTQDPAFARTVHSGLKNSVPTPYAADWEKAGKILMQYLPEGFSGNMTADEVLTKVSAAVQ